MPLSVGAVVAIAIGSAATAITALTVGAVALPSLGESSTPPPRSAIGVVVTRVIDGDTIVVAGGDRVRLIGIDTPEQGSCGAQEATDALAGLVEGDTVQLPNPRGVQDLDRYGRLLRYVDLGTKDAGYAMLSDGWADARYDSRDGFDRHPREPSYRATLGLVTSLCTQLERNRAARLEEAEDAAHEAGTFRRIDESATALLVRVQNRVRLQRQIERRWRDARRVAKLAGIGQRPGESADQLRRRAEHQLSAQRAASAAAVKRARDAAADAARDRDTAPSSRSPSRGTSGQTYSTDNDHGYTGRRCYAPGGQTFTPC